MRKRRTALVVEADRRMHELRARIGATVRQMRRRRRWSQTDLGRRTGLGRLVIGRVERGEGPFDVECLVRISVALDVPLAISFDRDLTDEPSDSGHLAIQEVVLRRAPGGYERGLEVPTRPGEPWRSADVGLWADRWRTAIDVECWNTFGDIGAAIRSSRRKLVELEAQAVARWGRDGRAALIWVVRDTARNRSLLMKYAASFAAFFTGSSRRWVDALTSAGEPPDKPGIVWCDTGSGRLYEHRPPRPRTSSGS